MKVFLCIRKVYVLSYTEDSYSQWMIFDIDTQNWTSFTNDLDFVFRCCYGNMLTIRNLHYYFNNDIGGVEIPWLKKPIYRILDNGTSIDLESEIPFAKEYLANDEVEELFFSQAPFYQRFYEEVQN